MSDERANQQPEQQTGEQYPPGVPPEDMAERFDDTSVEHQAEDAEQQGGGEGEQTAANSDASGADGSDVDAADADAVGEDAVDEEDGGPTGA